MEKRIRIALIVLAVLLAMSLTGLAVRITYLKFFAGGKSTVVLPDNFIGEETVGGSDESKKNSDDPMDTRENTPETSNNENDGNTSPTGADASDGAAAFVSTAESSSDAIMVNAFNGNNVESEQAVLIELYDKNPGDNVRFMETNMMPGDRVTKYYCVRVYHRGPIELNFRVDVVSQTKNLGNILDITVTRLDKSNTLLSSAFNSIDRLVFTEAIPGSPYDTATVAYYRVDVSLPTHAGNEYQAASLVADFNWYVMQEIVIKDDDKNDGDEDVDDVFLEDPIEAGYASFEMESRLLPKPHSTDALIVAFAVVSAISAVVLLILLVIIRRCREDEG